MRRYAKPGDLFDAWFLLSKGVRLTGSESAILRDEAEGAASDHLLDRFQIPRSGGWPAALRRAGVTGLNDETAASVVQTVRDYLREVIG